MSVPSPSEQVLSQHGAIIGLTPQLLQAYNAAMPGSGEKLLNAAMEEITHRRELEKSQLDAEVSLMQNQSREAFRGQIFAFLITLSFAGAGTYVISNGHPIAGTIFGGVGLGSIVSTFIWGRTRQSGQPSE